MGSSRNSKVLNVSTFGDSNKRDVRLADELDTDRHTLPLLDTETSPGLSDESVFNVMQFQKIDDDVHIGKFFLAHQPFSPIAQLGPLTLSERDRG